MKTQPLASRLQPSLDAALLFLGERHHGLTTAHIERFVIVRKRVRPVPRWSRSPTCCTSPLPTAPRSSTTGSPPVDVVLTQAEIVYVLALARVKDQAMYSDAPLKDRASPTLAGKSGDPGRYLRSESV